MALYDSASCLSAFNRYTGRPDTNDSISDADKYVRLSEAQQMVVGDMLPVVPNSLYPKVPYTMFPVAFPNSQVDGSGTLTLSGASFVSGATITATASTAQFTAAMVGGSLLAVNPATQIPVTLLITAYTSTTIVSVTALVNIPSTMQAVALTGWSIGSGDSATSNQVFTFGFNANGVPIMPMGKALILPSLASFPDFAWIEGLDYVNEGTQIRLTNNRTWTGALYWYGVPQPTDITASVNPLIFPEGARELIVFRAASVFADEGEGNTKLAERMQARYNEAWVRWTAAWKTQFSNGGALGSISGLRIAEAGGSLNGRNWSSF